MKKMNLTKLMAVLVVLCLITSTFVGSTLAKYVTSGTGEDIARVAKFGVTVTANGGLFAKGYKLADTISTETEGEASVWSSNTDNLLAPGTSGELAQMTLAGQPEVDVKVTYDAEVTINDKWVVNTENYFPIEVSVNGTPVAYAIDDDAADIEAAIEAAIEAYSKTYDANKDLSTVGADSLDITWAWDYEGNDDEKDTALGDAAAADLANAGKLTVNVKTIVTQVD